MQSKRHRVAAVMGACATGGVKSYLAGMLRNIPRDKFEITVYLYEGYGREDAGWIDDLGVSAKAMPRPSRPLCMYKSLYQEFAEENFDIVHGFLNTLNFIPMAAAARAKVPVRVSENLSAGNPREPKSWIKYVLRPLGSLFATDYAANSQLAAWWMWGGKKDKVTILNNPIDLSFYTFNKTRRLIEREELGISPGDPTVAWIGRYAPQKNPLFLVEVFSELRRINPQVRLLAMGYGPLEDEMRKRVYERGLQETIVLLPASEDIRHLYEVADAFVLPSLYEGLPIVAIEAQAMGLPCVLSSKITKEAAVGQACQFIDLSSGPKKWAEAVSEAMAKGRQDNSALLHKRGFGDVDSARELTNLWLKALMRERGAI